MQPRLLGKLGTVSPPLNRPGTYSPEHHERQCTGNLPRQRVQGTSLKKTCPPSLRVCFAFADQPGGVFMAIA